MVGLQEHNSTSARLSTMCSVETLLSCSEGTCLGGNDGDDEDDDDDGCWPGACG